MSDINRNTVQDIRNVLISKLADGDISENGTLEITGANFIANADHIFGKPSEVYIKKELKWYLSQDLHISGLGPEIPKIWKDVADENGFINSNYGWCIMSKTNGYQLENAVEALVKDENSRQSVMVYTRPTIHIDAFSNGGKDFICTNAVQMFIRNGQLDYHVSMRSNDVVFGYNNDYAWHSFVQEYALELLNNYRDYKVRLGDIHWSAGSLHVYSRHFDLVKGK